MSVIEELMGYKKNGLEFGILGRATLEIIERLEALEEVTHTPSESEHKPSPALSLDRIMDKYIIWARENPREALRAFAAELGVKS